MMRASKLSSLHRPARSATPVGWRRACWALMFGPFLLAAQTQAPPAQAPPKPEPVKTSITVVENISAETPANLTTLDSTARQKSPGPNLAASDLDALCFRVVRPSSCLEANPPRREISRRDIGSSGPSRTLVLWDGIP